jgi:hypothetical protein
VTQTAARTIVDEKRNTSAPDDLAEEPLPSGRVTRDDRGLAVWEWLPDDRPTVARAREPGLTIVEDAPAPAADKLRKELGGPGYNPYGTARLDQNPRPVKRDLRELSRWIELRKKHGAGPRE